MNRWIAGLGMGMGVLLLNPAEAQLPESRAVSLNTARIHIGDSVVDPKPVGTSWKLDFTLDETPKWAAVKIEAVDSSLKNTVLLNDIELGALIPSPGGVWRTTTFPIPLPALKKGSNTLKVRGTSRSGNFDDFEIRNIALSIGLTDPPEIGAVSRSSAPSGTTVIVTGLRFHPEKGEIFLDGQPVPGLFTSVTQALFRVPVGIAPGPHPITVRYDGVSSAPADFSVVAGAAEYQPVLSGGGEPSAAAVPGDVAPHLGKDGRLFGDGVVNLLDVTRILRRALGLEPDPWP